MRMIHKLNTLEVLSKCDHSPTKLNDKTQLKSVLFLVIILTISPSSFLFSFSSVAFS